MRTWRNQRMPALILSIILLLALPAAALPPLEEFAARLKPMAQNTTIQADMKN